MRHAHTSDHALAARPYHSPLRTHPPPIPHPAPAHAIAFPISPLACCRADTTTAAHALTRNKQLHRSRSSRSIEEGERRRGFRGAGDRDWNGNRRGVERDWSIGLFLKGVGENRRRAAMGRLFLMHLEGNVYSCKHCRTHLGLAGDIISKAFHCKHGKAYLFNKVVNVTNGVKEDRLMMTGLHTVSDIFCVGCGSIVGWKYEAAHEKSQRYKEGKFILERYKVSGPDGSSYWATHDAHLGGSDADDV